MKAKPATEQRLSSEAFREGPALRETMFKQVRRNAVAPKIPPVQNQAAKRSNRHISRSDRRKECEEANKAPPPR